RIAARRVTSACWITWRMFLPASIRASTLARWWARTAVPSGVGGARASMTASRGSGPSGRCGIASRSLARAEARASACRCRFASGVRSGSCIFSAAIWSVRYWRNAVWYLLVLIMVSVLSGRGGFLLVVGSWGLVVVPGGALRRTPAHYSASRELRGVAAGQGQGLLPSRGSGALRRCAAPCALLRTGHRRG